MKPSLSSLTFTLLLSSLPTFAEAASIRFTVLNQSKHVIESAYASPSRNPKWGANLLETPLEPGGTVEVAIEGACGKYDIRFVAKSGTELLDEEVQFCAGGDVVTLGDATIRRTKPPKK